MEILKDPIMALARKSFFTALLGLLLFPAAIFAQETSNPSPENVPQKFALVIGNGAYSGGLPQLANPVNDANDVAAALQSLGFTVDKVLNGTLQQMEDASLRLKDSLGTAGNAYGFFFYAGHGVQSSGDNYLIPVDADIPTESYLRTRAVSVQTLLDDLNDARNGLNIVVLDACRDNPFGWNRSTTRGLTIISRQPADSIIVYSTSAGQRASDGEGRNGLFTSQLLPNLLTPGLEVKDVFNRTGADVSDVSHKQQVPAVYNQFFGTAYLGIPPDAQDTNAIIPRPQIIIGGAKPENDPAKFWSVGASFGSSFAAPWILGTAHGTIAPFKYTFLELGFDTGFVSGEANVGYYSLYPYAHLAFFWPLMANKIGLYAGLGGGYLMVSYNFTNEGKYTENFMLGAVTAGVNFLDMIDVSYTLKTNFSARSHKVSVGYTYRFK